MNNGFTQNELRAMRALLEAIELNTGGTGSAVDITNVGGSAVSTDSGYSGAGTQVVNLAINNPLTETYYYTPELEEKYCYPYFRTNFNNISRNGQPDLGNSVEQTNLFVVSNGSNVFDTGLRWENKPSAADPGQLDWWHNGSMPDSLCSMFMTFRLRMNSAATINLDFYIGLKQYQLGKTANINQAVAAFSFNGQTRGISAGNSLVPQNLWNVDTVDGSEALETNRSKYDISTSDPSFYGRFGIEYNYINKSVSFYAQHNTRGNWILLHTEEVTNIAALRPFIHWRNTQNTSVDFNTTISEMSVNLCHNPIRRYFRSLSKSVSGAITIPPLLYGYLMVPKLRYFDIPPGSAKVGIRNYTIQLDPLAETNVKVQLLFVNNFYDDLNPGGGYSTGAVRIQGNLIVDENTSYPLTTDPPGSVVLQTKLTNGADVISIDIPEFFTDSLFGYSINTDSIGNPARSSVVLRVYNESTTNNVSVIGYSINWEEY